MAVCEVARSGNLSDIVFCIRFYYYYFSQQQTTCWNQNKFFDLLKRSYIKLNIQNPVPILNEEQHIISVIGRGTNQNT